MGLQAVVRGAGETKSVVGSSPYLFRSLDFILQPVERTEGCKQLIESMPVTVPCARLLTDAPLKSYNTPAK